jgi:hypothetical protein
MAKRRRQVTIRPYLAELLTNLTEPEQLFYELVQNADDDANATEICFTFSPSDLTVWNDGKFSRCTNYEDVSLSCNFGDGRPSSNRRCDFHRLEEIQNAEKSKETDTTGAFGIGFNCVFRVSDKPELISNGVHLSFYNDESEPGMDTCEERECMRGCADSSGTKLILPWATEEGSEGRNFYEQPAITPTDFARYEEAAVDSAPMALLFNTNLKKISVESRDGTIHRWSKTVDGETATISSADSRQRWRKFHRDLSEDSLFLAKHLKVLGENEANKHLSIAVREDAEESTRAGVRQGGGRLFVTFPTEVETHLPVHVNAKFQPERSRRRLKLDGDLGEWNKDLVVQAGQAIAAEIVPIRDALGSPVLFWELVDSAWIAKQRGPDDLGITNYWDASLKEVLKSQKVIWAESDSWMAVDDVRYRLLDKDDKGSNQRVIHVLGKLGVETVHWQIQQKIEQTSGEPILKELGVKELSLTDVAAALKRSDLSEGIDQFLGGKHLLRALWEECNRLLKGQKGAPIQPLALWPTTAGSYKPARDMFRADDDYEIRRIVEGFCLDVEFLDDEMPSSFEGLRGVVDSFQLVHLVDAIAASIDSNATKLAQVDDKQRKRLFKWIYDHKEELEDDPSLKKRLASLPLYPTEKGPRSLEVAYWPTGFKDRLGVVETINLDALSKEGRELLELLDVKKLNFETYCTESLPDAFRDDKVKPGQQRDLIKELATNLKRIAESAPVLEALKGLPIIECRGDEPQFLEAGRAYFASKVVKGVLGSQAVFAVENSDTDELLSLLGVSGKPRLPDVVDAVEALCLEAVDKKTKSQVSETIEFLATEWPTAKDDGPEDDLEARIGTFTRSLGLLRTLAWLPGTNRTVWQRPEDLAARVDQHLFEDQAVFLDIVKEKQAKAPAKAFLEWLGLQIEPEPHQVVAQLSHCGKSGKRVHPGVYQYLDDQAKSRGDDLFGPLLDEVFEPLQGRPCLLVDIDGEGEADFKYLAPYEVFRSQPPFGRYRYQLPKVFQDFPGLLTELGVKESPDAEDVRRLLKELSAAADSAPMNAEDKGVIEECWRILEKELRKAEEHDREGLPEELVRLKELLREIGRRATFFDRASIAEWPGKLVLNDSYTRASYLTSESRESLVEENGFMEALFEAGAKRLSTDLKFVIVDEHLLKDDIAFEEHLEERWELIKRLVAHYGDDTNALERLQELGPRIEVRSYTTLRATLWIYRTTLNQDHPVEINAFFNNEKKELLYKSEGPTPWRDIVTELFAVLDMPPLVSLWFETVLQKKTVQDAELFLEEHNVPTLRVNERTEYPSAMPTVGQTVDAEGVLEDTGPDSDGGSSAGAEGSADLGFEGDFSTDANSQTEDDAEGDQRLGPEADLDPGEEASGDSFWGGEESGYPDDDHEVSDDHPDPEATGDSRKERPATGESHAGGRPQQGSVRPGSASKQQQSGQTGPGTPSTGKTGGTPRPGGSGGSPLSGLVYVSGSSNHGLGDESNSKEVGEQGELAVVAFEEGEDRTAERLEDTRPNHPGWDIVSVDGDEVRYIEVKTTTGTWGSRGVGLTEMQFREAQSLGDEYWLYVVENLDSPDEVIHMIQNPVGRLSRMQFNGDWRAFAETGTRPRPEGLS